jgi:hypothetical protein
MDVRLPFNLIWKKDNSSPLLQRFVAQVEALGRKKSMRADGIKGTDKHRDKLRARTPKPGRLNLGSAAVNEQFDTCDDWSHPTPETTPP